MTFCCAWVLVRFFSSNQKRNATGFYSLFNWKPIYFPKMIHIFSTHVFDHGSLNEIECFDSAWIAMFSNFYLVMVSMYCNHSQSEVE